MSRRFFVASLLLVLTSAPGLARVASAQEASDKLRLDLSTAFANADEASAVAPAAQLPTFFRPVVDPYRKPSQSSQLMLGLYAATAVMQALDIHSTLSAFNAGAVEGNPLMTGVTGNKASFIAMKAAVATGAIFAARGVAKRNKVAAIATLVAINSAYAMVARHNYQVASGR